MLENDSIKQINLKEKKNMNIVKVGMIGCGAFARAMHLPILQKNPKCIIHAVMDLAEEPAKETAAEFEADYWTTDLDRLLNDKDIDAVFITTRHDTHASLSIKAAEAGKHVLCEKPMGLSAEECRRVCEAVRANGVKYTVGYNRGMAPLVVQARERLKELKAKKLIYHRIQAPFVSDHWTHDPEVGGGRFVGEGCHIFDLLCELVDKEPVRVYASGGVFLDPEKVKIPDSGIITITFADGSVGTTLIASAGTPLFPKEATEVYCDSRAVHIEDFKKMTCCGFKDEECEESLLEQVDKGQYIEVEQFLDSILNDSDPPNGLVKAARAAIISYKVHESIEKNEPVSIQRNEYDFSKE